MRARRVAAASLILALASALPGAVVWVGSATLGQGRVDPSAASRPAPRSPAPPAPPERPGPRLGPWPGARSAAPGLTLTSAVAYVVPKHVTLREEETRVVPLDERGCAAFPGLDPRECWIGARAEAHVAEVVDGDAWDGQDVQRTLAQARAVEVELRSADGALPPDTWVSLDPPGPRTEHELPGRGDVQDFWFSSKVERIGTISFAPPTNGPLQLGVHAPGRCAVEEHGQITPLTVLGPYPCGEVQVYDAFTEESVWRVGKR